MKIRPVRSRQAEMRTSTTFCIVSVIVLMAMGLLVQSCLKFSNTYTAIPPGMWRGMFDLSVDSADVAEEHTLGVLPFNFEVVYVTPDSFHVIIHNGTERITCTEIAFARDESIGKDTIRIVLPAFGTYITGKYEEDVIEGDWWDPSRGSEYKVGFKAQYGKDHRFALVAGAGYKDFSGRWKSTFGTETPSPEPAIAVIEQQGNHATGTILTETGDYRYLEGSVEDDRLYLSTFDGSHAYLFEAKLLPDQSISGIYRSGNHYKTYWVAQRDDTFQLSDPNTMTALKDSTLPFTFRFPNTDGILVSPEDAKYRGKPKIITIFGTWCPNCLDETAFLTEYMRMHPDLDLAIISIAFERQKDPEKALATIRNYKSYFNIPWEIVVGGSSKKDHVLESLPELRNFESFPTMIFLDRNNHVIKIHTGFFGPATDKFQAFKSDFEETVQALISTQPNG